MTVMENTVEVAKVPKCANVVENEGGGCQVTVVEMGTVCFWELWPQNW